MNTVTLWLLISLGANYYGAGPNRPSVVVERFTEAGECQRVANVLNQPGRLIHQCVQATVYKP